jgi:hypothetical protein
MMLVTEAETINADLVTFTQSRQLQSVTGEGECPSEHVFFTNRDPDTVS